MNKAVGVPFRAVLFDLDDTLLYNDMEGVFLDRYFTQLAEYASPVCTPRKFMAALTAGSAAMHRDQDPDGPTNKESFAMAFAPRIGKPWAELDALFARFYEERFPELHIYAHAHPDARQAIQVCLDTGCQVVIATNPLFPARAIEHRLAWARIDDLPFALVTTYENMHTCKPNPAYYAEIADRIRVASGECLMVGNDVMRDIVPAQQIGMHTFLAEEWIVNPDPTVQPDRSGQLSDLIAWIENGGSQIAGGT